MRLKKTDITVEAVQPVFGVLSQVTDDPVRVAARRRLVGVVECEEYQRSITFVADLFDLEASRCRAIRRITAGKRVIPMEHSVAIPSFHAVRNPAFRSGHHSIGFREQLAHSSGRYVARRLLRDNAMARLAR
jgi:hypothetical protein